MIFSKSKFIHIIMLNLFVNLLVANIDAATLIAHGFWQSSGTRNEPNVINDPGNIIYHFTATSNGTVSISLGKGFVFDYTDNDFYLKLYKKNRLLAEGDTSKIKDENDSLKAEINYTVLKDSSYSVVATTKYPGCRGTFSVKVEGPVKESSIRFATPLTVISSNGDALSIENGRSACLYSNVDLYPAPGPSVKYKHNGRDTASIYPFPFYLNVNPATIGEYSAVINGSVTSTIILDTFNRTTSVNKWVQKDFVITGWHDPHFTNINSDDSLRVRDWREAGFTLLSGTGMDRKYNNNPNYVLKRIVSENNCKSPPLAYCMINEEPTISLKGACQDFTQIKSDILNALSYYSESNLSNDKRSAILGYFLGQEPSAFQMTTTLSTMELVGSKDSTKAAFPILNNDYGGYEYYTAYVRTYVKSPWAKVLLSTDYPFNAYTSTGYYSTTYFKRLNLYATEIKSAGNKVNLWGTGNCSEVYSKRHSPLPTQSMLRYYAFGPVTYGGKGILWYLYNGDNTERNNSTGFLHYPHNVTNNGVVDHIIYDSITLVNNELQRMGPTLMKLRWIGTFHGDTTDPSSKEPDLPTGYILPVISVSKPVSVASNWSKDSICVGVHTDGTDSFLTVFNKSLYPKPQYSSTYSGNPNKSTFTTRGLKYPIIFNKSLGKWENITRTGYNATTKQIQFEVTTNPGDMQLIRLAPDGFLPVADLNISSIGSPTATRVEANASEITIEGRCYTDFRYDNLCFANRQMKYDYEIDVRIDELPAGSAAGIMVRSSLNRDAKMVYLHYDKTAGCVYIWARTYDQASAVYMGTDTNTTLSCYLRMRGYADNAYCFFSNDGKKYTLLKKIPFTKGIFNVGLTQTSSDNTLSKAKFSKFRLHRYDSSSPTRNCLLQD